MYKMRTQYGCSKLENLWFTTITYEMGKRAAVDAVCASIHLRKLLQRLRRRSRWKDLAWCRVTELTKRGQVHHHMMIGSVTGVGRCQTTTLSRKRRYKEWYEGKCSAAGEECLNHEIAKVWHAVTGDSFVVDVDAVRTEKGLSEYLSKYLDKGMAEWGKLNELGFQRRWNCSRNFPSPGRLRLAGSDQGDGESEWEIVERFDRGLLAKARGLGRRSKDKRETCLNMGKVGIDMNADIRKESQIRKIEKRLGVLV